MTFTQKYQPQSLNQCLFPNTATETYIKNVAANATTQNLVLYGPMGTGKSLIASLVASQLESSRAVVTELFQGTQLRTAAKADEIIDRIEMQRRTINIFADRRLYIIEEFDRVHRDSQLGFAHLLTTPGLQFILTTNEIHDIDPRIISRAQPCSISGAVDQNLEELAKRVLCAEGVDATDAEIAKHVRAAAGNVRDFLNGLEGFILLKRKSAAAMLGNAAPQPPGSLAVTVVVPEQGAPSAQHTP